MTGHRHFKCEQPCQVAHCRFCEGGLSFCTTCLCAEVQLTKECPGYPVQHGVQDSVTAGEIDYTEAKGWYELPLDN